MDLSGLLLAAELGILDLVEKEFQPIRISESLPLSLVQQLELLTPNQPSQLALHLSIVSKVKDNSLQLIPEPSDGDDTVDWGLGERLDHAWIVTANRAKNEGAFIVEHLPLRDFRDGSLVDLPSPLQTSVINCRSVLEALRENGPLSNIKYQDALRDLGSEAVPLLGHPPLPSKARLYLLGASTGILASAGILDVVCDWFEGFIPRAIFQFAEAQIKEHEHRLDMIQWVNGLIERVRNGIDQGTYEILPTTKSSHNIDPKHPPAAHYELRSFTDLLHFKVEPGDVIWVDDRYVNAYGQREGARIVSVTDVLRRLLTSGRINEVDYYRSLLKLRSSNMRYLPLASDEILHHLLQANVINNSVVATEELACLRSSLAASLLDADNLQKSPQPEDSANRFGEINFVFESTAGVIEAIVSLWADESLSFEDAEARSEWLLANLYTGRFGCRHLLPDAVVENNDELNLAGIDIAELFAKAVGIDEDQRNRQKPSTSEAREKSTELSRRQRYFAWLNSRLVTPRLKADPASIAAASKVLRNVFRASAERQFNTAAEGQYSRKLMQHLYLDLPNDLQEQTRYDPDLLDWIGIRVTEAVNVNGIAFPPEEFWKAAEAAMNERDAVIEAFNQANPFRLRKSLISPRSERSSDERQYHQGKYRADNPYRSTDFQPTPALDVLDLDGNVVTRFENAMLGLVGPEIAERLDVLHANRHWFDMAPDATEREMSIIASISHPRERVDRANVWGKQSAATFYLGLQQRMLVNNGFQREDLTKIDSSGLLQHFRLRTFKNSPTSFQQALSAAAILLFAEEGLEGALHRMSLLPVRIPDLLSNEIQKLAPSDQDLLFTRFTTLHPSPVGRLHAIDLILRSVADNTTVARLALPLVDELFSESTGVLQFKLFKSVLVAVNEEFGFREDLRAWSPAIRLAMVWAHTTNLYDIVHRTFIAKDQDLKELSDWFVSPNRQLSAEMFQHDADCLGDCAHPSQLRRIEFLSLGSLELLRNHNPARLEQICLFDHIKRTAFDKSDGMFLPNQDLLADNRLTTNLTGSFLSGDKAVLFEPVIGTTSARCLSGSYLQEVVRHEIKNLSSTPAKWQDWAVIASILGGQLLYQELREDFRNLVRGLAFDQVMNLDMQAALTALVVISSQSQILSDDERSLCGGWLLAYLKNFDNPNGQTAPQVHQDASNEDDLSLLLGCAFELSLKPGDQRGSAMSFSSLILQMIGSRDSLNDYLETALQRAVLELPVRQLEGMWLAMLSTRTSRR